MVKKKHNPKIPARCEVLNETADGVDLYLYGTIEDDDSLIYYYEDEIENLITPGKVRDLIDTVGGKEVNIHLNSNGGSIYGSVAIMNYLQSIPNKVNIFIDSVAFSGASIISMSGDTVNMYPNSMMMIHKAGASFYGNSKDFREMAEVLDKFDEVVLNSYLKRFKGTDEDLRNLINNETYLSAKDCQDLGLCDNIVGEEQGFPTIQDINNKVKNLIGTVPTDGERVLKPVAQTEPIQDDKEVEAPKDKPEDDDKELKKEVKNKSILDKFKKEKGAI